MRPCLLLLPLAACTSLIDADRPGKNGNDDGDTGPSSAADLCAASTPLETTVPITFEATYEGCAWGEGGNLEANDAHVSGRVEQTESLDLGEGVVMCDTSLDFAPNGGMGQGMQYDDNFFFAFDDVVLAASYAPLVEEFPTDGNLPIYSWEAIAGLEFGFETDGMSYCLGEDDGLADCEIPPPETDGRMTLSFDDSIISQLAERALSLDRLDYTFITIGDNDDSDCSHAEFTFDVAVSYVEE